MSTVCVAAQLLSLENGKATINLNNGLIRVPDHFCNDIESIEVLKRSVFTNIQRLFDDHKWLCERVRLAPENNSVNVIPLQMQQVSRRNCILQVG
jgi:hypothetical protein